jgi:hypothetical protein
MKKLLLITLARNYEARIVTLLVDWLNSLYSTVTLAIRSH